MRSVTHVFHQASHLVYTNHGNNLLEWTEHTWLQTSIDEHGNTGETADTLGDGAVTCHGVMCQKSSHGTGDSETSFEGHS